MTLTSPPDELVDGPALLSDEPVVFGDGAAAGVADLSDPGLDDDAPLEISPRSARLLLASATTVAGAAVMVGGMFQGVSGRIYALLAGVLGLLLADLLARSRKPVVVNLAFVVGLFGIGLVLVLPSGVGNVFELSRHVAEASKSGDVLRPPVPITPGWQAIIGWTMGTVGFLAGWVAVKLQRPSIALLLPLPVAAMGGISVPESAQVASGIAVLVLFALGLGIMSNATAGGDDESGPGLGFELRRAARALPMVGIITVVLVVLARTDFLFPEPVINPEQEAQKPKTVPLSEVEDRVLFEVDSTLSGPWRLGSLDVYDGEDWRLPPFAQNRLKPVPKSGVVDPDLPPDVAARFRIAGLGGAVLPGLPNTDGVKATGPQLAFDARNGNIRLIAGQVRSGLEYTVLAANVPNVDALRLVTEPVPKDIEQFAKMPSGPPSEAAALIAQAPTGNRWDQFDFLRTWILDNVVVTGAGAPKSITPERVADMIAGSKEGTPFEIVAAQAMLARWVGVPSRIGYGFDGGEKVGQLLQVRPKNGSTFIEVYFPGYKWLPVIGTPKKAKATVGGDPDQQQFNPDVLPSGEITVQVFLPVVFPPESNLVDHLKRALIIGVPILLLIGLVYLLYPVVAKSVIRSRRRTAALAAGPRARVLLAYAEWRDIAADFGYEHPSDTPLMFLDRIVPDREHAQLAWLVTRVAWADLRDRTDASHAEIAEELSRALRRRLSQAHPGTLRLVAALSRISVRRPYAPTAHEEVEVARAA